MRGKGEDFFGCCFRLGIGAGDIVQRGEIARRRTDDAAGPTVVEVDILPFEFFPNLVCPSRKEREFLQGHVLGDT